MLVKLKKGGQDTKVALGALFPRHLYGSDLLPLAGEIKRVINDSNFLALLQAFD